MIGRQKRLNEVYQHLRQYRGIHTKTDFAEALHYGRTSMSAALNGNDSYLTDSLFKNICDAFPHTFNLQYLLTGEGELTIEQPTSLDLGSSSTLASVGSPDVQKQKEQVDITTDLLTQSAKLIAQNEAIRRQLLEELTLLQQLRQDYTTAIQHLNQATAKLTSNYFPSLAAEPKKN